jgi:hyaluronan synthase
VKGVGFVAFALILTALSVLWWAGGGPSWYGVAVMSLLAIKLVLSWRGEARPARTALQLERLRRLRVGVAIPVYNEDPGMLAASLSSLLNQTRLPESIVVVDDGSPDRRALAEAERWVPRFAEAGVRMLVIPFPENRGKREALIAALEAQPGIDLLVGVDSDTVLDHRALQEALVPFLDPRVTVVTGLVLALNHNRNLLTRLIDIRYANAFLFERAAYSALGSVLCACGSLSVYRTDVLHRYKKDFLTQTFLGRPAVFGDDRRLTNYGLLEGRAIFQRTAIAYTAVPERWGHFLRQQIRWNKSFFRESVWVLAHMPATKWAFWLTAAEMLTWVVFSATVGWAIVVAPVLTGALLVGPYLLYVTLVGYARSVRYLDLTGVKQSRKDRTIGFLISPLYGLVHILLLMWLRVYALATLRSGSWGTRASVEVALHSTDEGRPPAGIPAG